MPEIGASDPLLTLGLIGFIWVTTLGGAMLYLSQISRRSGPPERRRQE